MADALWQAAGCLVSCAGMIVIVGLVAGVAMMQSRGSQERER